MKLSYKKKLFIYFFIVFAIFTVIIIFFQQDREKEYKTETLRASLNEYADIIDLYIEKSQLLQSGRMDSVRQILSKTSK